MTVFLFWYLRTGVFNEILLSAVEWFKFIAFNRVLSGLGF